MLLAIRTAQPGYDSARSKWLELSWDARAARVSLTTPPPKVSELALAGKDYSFAKVRPTLMYSDRSLVVVTKLSYDYY